MAILISIIFLIPALTLFGQDTKWHPDFWREAGLPYIRNFSPQEYGGEIQNFALVQDSQGLIYAGNNIGVLIYDGVAWRHVFTPRRTLVRSLCSVNGKIYVGSVGDFGYLQAGPLGEERYISLLDYVPEHLREFQDVYDILPDDSTMHFRTRSAIMSLTDNRMNIVMSDKILGSAISVGGKLYVHERNTGLMHVQNETLKLVRGGELFADKTIRFMFPYDGSKIMIGTFASGLYLYDQVDFKVFKTSVDDFLYEHQLRDGSELSEGLIALATNRGVVILDKDGQLCQIVNKHSGLRDELVIKVFPDRQGGLWLGLNNGLARVETPAPISRFRDASGIESFIQGFIRHQGRLYVATDRGASYLDSSDFPFPRFKPITGISILAFELLSVDDRLLLATQEGVFEILGGRAKQINTLEARCLYRSRQNPDIIWAGLISGLALFKFEDGRWLQPYLIPGISERIKALAEDDKGRLWAGTLSSGVLRVDSGHDSFEIPDNSSQIEVSRFGSEHGLPNGTVFLTRVNGRILFATPKGLLRFDDSQASFQSDSVYSAIFPDSSQAVSHIQEDDSGNIFIVTRQLDKNVIRKAVPQQNGTYQWKNTLFLRMNDLGNAYLSYPEKDGVVWFGGSEGIARVATNMPKNHTSDFPTLIRRVSDISMDSVFYFGAVVGGMAQTPEISYQHNSLRFEFAALSFDDPAANEYQYQLAGFDPDWSQWKMETRKDYTGLNAGDYVFKVRGRNIHDEVGRVAEFAFIILPPWYLTHLAFAAYFITICLLVIGVVKVRVRHLEKKTSELEAVIADRTRVIRRQTEKLKELDRVKSRFFANISHEFRTPLTLLLGPLEDRISRATSESDRVELGIMHRNARRVLELINQLLDLSRLEYGKMTISAAPGNFLEFLRGIVMAFASLAEQREISLSFNVNSDGSEAYYTRFDKDIMEKIFNNLLSNAIKFTSAAGEVFVEVSRKPANETETSSGIIEIKVKDTGIGIPSKRLPYIFDRFYQVSGEDIDNIKGQNEGTGIGLALTKELVELHKGSITVQSIEGVGTEFVVYLPFVEISETEADLWTIQDAADLTGYEIKPIVNPSDKKGSGKSEPVELLSSTQSGLSNTERPIVLIVEDHPDVSEFIAKHLKSDYEIMTARDGLEGLDAAIEVIPDLVISDVMMPELDGIELCHQLKNNMKTSHIPVILLTARAGETDKLAGLETGADDYLTKPFSPKELQTRVHNLIEQRRKLRARFMQEGVLQPREVAVTSMDESFLHKVMKVIEEQISQEDFGVDELSRQVNVSARQLHRKVQALTGRSPVEVIRSVRLQRAHQLLAAKSGSVSEIAFQVGFANLSYFAKCFNEVYGELPSEFIANK